MKAIICGHGPSMLQNLHGELIDSYDVVIRQKRCEETLKHPKQFGTRTDVVCGSWTIGSQLPVHMPGCKYWVFTDSRHEDVPDEDIQRARIEIPAEIRPWRCREWNQFYRDCRTPTMIWDRRQEHKATSDEYGHTHMSAGLHTLMYAGEFLHPNRVTLVGFDNVRSGTFTWSVTRGDGWQHYPDHRWDVERKLVPIMAQRYQMMVDYA